MFFQRLALNNCDLSDGYDLTETSNIMRLFDVELVEVEIGKMGVGAGLGMDVEITRFRLLSSMFESRPIRLTRGPSRGSFLSRFLADQQARAIIGKDILCVPGEPGKQKDGFAAIARDINQRCIGRALGRQQARQHALSRPLDRRPDCWARGSAASPRGMFSLEIMAPYAVRL